MERYILTILNAIISKTPRLTGLKFIPETTIAIADVKQSAGHKVKISVLPFDNGNVKVELFDTKGFKCDALFTHEYYANNYNGNYSEIGTAVAEFIDSILGPYNETEHHA